MLVGLILNRQRKSTWKGEREDTWKANHGEHENNTSFTILACLQHLSRLKRFSGAGDSDIISMTLMLLLFMDLCDQLSLCVCSINYMIWSNFI